MKIKMREGFGIIDRFVHKLFGRWNDIIVGVVRVGQNFVTF